MAFRRLIRRTAIALVLVAAAAASAIVVAQSDWGQQRARDFLISKAGDVLAGDFSVRSLRWSLDGHAELEGVTLVQDGKPLFAADAISVRYRPWRVLTSGVALEEVVVRRPAFNIEQRADGWNVGRIFKPRRSERPANVSFRIDRLRLVDGGLVVTPLAAPVHELATLNVESDLVYADQILRSSISRASAHDVRTGLELRQLVTDLRIGDGALLFEKIDVLAGASHVTGQLTIPTVDHGPLRIELVGDPVLLTDVAPYSAVVRGIGLSPQLSINAHGTADQLTGDVSVRSQAGDVQAKFSGGFGRDTTRFTGDAAMSRLDLAPWLRRPDLAGQITGRTTFDITVPRAAPEKVTVRFDATAAIAAVGQYRAERVSARGTWGPRGLESTASGVAYGSSVQGHVSWDSGTSTLQTNGRFADLDLRRLPAHLNVPRMATSAGGTFDLTFTDKDDAWRVDAVLDRSTVEDATIAQGTIVRIDARQTPAEYEIRGGFAHLDPDRFKGFFTSVPPVLDKLHGLINAHVALVGRGTTLADADSTIEVDLRESVISGVKVPALTSHATIKDRRAVIDLDGELADLSSEAFELGNRAEFSTSGKALAHLEIADVTGPLRPDTIDGTVTVAFAGGHAVGMDLQTVDIDATLARGLADIRRLEIAGSAGTLSASGPLGLAGDGQSNLDYRIAISDLHAFETLAGRPMSGTAALQGRVVGPAADQKATGSLQGNSLAVDGVRALSVAGTFGVTLRDRDWRHANSSFDGNGTFIEIDGTEIKTATGKVTYDGVRFVADATLEQEQRTVSFAGAMIPHPEHREIHITSLEVTTGQTTWQTPAGQEAVAQYSSSQIVVRGLELGRDDARIRVNGTLGTTAASDTPLVVTLEHVSLEDVSALLLSSQKLTGQLDATARITGEVKEPRVDAEVKVAAGSVNGVRFDSLTGTVRYTANQLGMNIQLEAGTSGRLTAEGTMPLGASGDAAAAPPYDLRLQSPAINLALFQPLMTHLEQLQGSGSFDLKITGPASAPLAHGDAAITGASFTMAVTGVRYSKLEARVAAEGDVLNVQQFELSDLDGHVANIAGTMKISERGTPGAFNLRLTATDFHLLRNQYGDLSLSPDLRFSGDLKSPLVVGTIHVERGRLEVSDILERFGASGYQKAESATEKVAQATGPEGPTGGASFSIALEMPDNLVLRGRDLRGPRGSIGLGDVNVMLGGAVTIAKDPTGPVTLVGGLSVARGSYSFQGRRFTILPDSTVHFRGEELLDPFVDVRAERQIGGVTANVHVTGTAQEPQIALSSDPPLDQGDILSLIVFNQTMNQLPTAQRTSLATRAGTLAARAFATPIADSVARALDFDLFEIAPTEDVNGGAILTIGRQVSDRLFVGFRQEFGPDDLSQVSFEYRLNQFLKFVTSFAQGTERDRTGPRAERAAGDFIFVIRR